MEMKDEDGVIVPRTDDIAFGAFEISMIGDGTLILTIPLCVDMGEDYYNSGGTHFLTVSLRSVFDDYIEDVETLDGGKNLEKISSLLSEYSEKLNILSKKLA